jgi:hypothetical protein
MIGDVLGWKFNHAPGIATRDGAVVAWPAALGPPPTQADIDTWTAEYAAAKPDVDAAAALDGGKLARLLFEIVFDQENRIRVLAGQAAVTRAQYRAQLIAVLKALA